MGIVDMKEVDDIDLDDDDDDNDEDNEKPKTPKGSLSKSKSNLKERYARYIITVFFFPSFLFLLR
jgi:hypothetical protein